MLFRAVPLPLLVASLLILAACGSRAVPTLGAEDAYARLPEEIGGFVKQRPDAQAARTVIARYANPNQASASIHAMPPSRRSEAEEEIELDAAVEVFARATVSDAALRRENATLRHFAARVAETGPAARCLDVQLRGSLPRRQLGCAAMLERRVFIVTMIAPEAADQRQGLRDPLLAVTIRLIGALSGQPYEPVAEPPGPPVPLPPAAAPPAPARPRIRPPAPSAPTWRT